MIDDNQIACEIVLQCRKLNPGVTLCPSEVARALTPDSEAWSPLMPAVRRVAAVLAREGLIVATQRGVRIDAKAAHGPIRLALCVNPVDLRAALKRITVKG